LVQWNLLLLVTPILLQIPVHHCRVRILYLPYLSTLTQMLNIVFRTSIVQKKNVAPVLKNKKSKEQNFTAPEDLLLCTTWLQISSDPIVHTGQRREGLWTRIEKRYNEQRGQYPCRLNRALSSRWDKIRADVSKFSGYYARVLRENQSGLTDDDKVRQII
jgi:hypothetical protein